MSELFDELARSLARPMPRSRAVRVLGEMKEARRLGRSLGSIETAPHRLNPVAGSSFRELVLRDPTPGRSVQPHMSR
jgi:hypothetical protein